MAIVKPYFSFQDFLAQNPHEITAELLLPSKMAAMKQLKSNLPSNMAAVKQM